MNAPASTVEPSENARSGERIQCVIDADTSSVPPAEQFDFFRSWYAGVCEFKILRGERHSFPARQVVWDFDKLTLVDLKVPDLRWSWRFSRNSILDNSTLILRLPKIRIPGGGLGAGDPGLYSLTDSFDYIFENSDFLALFMPRKPSFRGSAKVEIREDMKQMLTDYMLLLHRSAPDLRCVDVPHIAGATISLLTACLVPSRDHIAEAQRPIEAVIMNRASQMIAKHLANPKLTPGLLCREIGVSRSGLYRIFEPVGGVSTYIRLARLRKTRDALADSSDRRPISAIAAQWGFMDPSAYSRVFRKEFGISPKEARAEGWLNVKFARPTDEAPTLRSLLLRNG